MGKPFRVVFTYDETSSLWEPSVENCEDKVEARQGFSAVVLTCQGLNPNLLVHTQVSDDMVITPAV